MSADDPFPDDKADDGGLPVEEAFAELGAALRPITPRPIARDRLMQALHGRERYAPELRAKLGDLFALDDAGIDALVDRINTAAAWLPGPMPGVSLIPLTPADLPTGPLPDGPTRLLVRIEPGLPFPAHEHLGDEHMLILEGALTTDQGELVTQGMCKVSAPGSRHAFVIHADGDCIAAVRLGGGILLVTPS